jgi:nitrate reductase gamma subunit
MFREKVRAALWGVLATLVLAALIVLGSRNLADFDAALVGYTFATLFAAFGIAYRYAMWLQRPPTALYWRRGWQLIFRPGRLSGNVVELARRVVGGFAFNAFIWRRGKARWAAHWLIMWGCLLASAVTFPLVFGWVAFESEPGDLDSYRTMVFGFPGPSFHIESLLGFLIFHALVWASFLVVAGVMLAMRRRMVDRGAEAVQQFGEDVLPLILLFAVSVTGLMLTASTTWMRGYAYDFLAILHAAIVIFTLLWLPFGKLFHIFMRPAQLGVSFYKDVGRRTPPAHCRRCGEPFASEMHVRDLIDVERRLGYRYELDDPDREHNQWICPRCRRILPATAQGLLWGKQPGVTSPADTMA